MSHTTVTAPATTWVLTTTEAEGTSISLHASQDEAYRTLREAFEVPEWITDEALADELLNDPVAGVLDIKVEPHDTPRA